MLEASAWFWRTQPMKWMNIAISWCSPWPASTAVDGKFVSYEVCCAQESQLWLLKFGVFLYYMIIDDSCGLSDWYFPLDVQVPGWKTPALICPCFPSIYQESTAKSFSNQDPHNQHWRHIYPEIVFWHSLLRPGLTVWWDRKLTTNGILSYVSNRTKVVKLNMYIIRAEPSCLLTMHMLFLAQYRLPQCHQLPHPYILYQQKFCCKQFRVNFIRTAQTLNLAVRIHILSGYMSQAL